MNRFKSIINRFRRRKEPSGIFLKPLNNRNQVGIEIYTVPNDGRSVGLSIDGPTIRVLEKRDGEWETVMAATRGDGTHWICEHAHGETPLILDDFTRAEDGPPPSLSWIKSKRLNESYEK